MIVSIDRPQAERLDAQIGHTLLAQPVEQPRQRTVIVAGEVRSIAVSVCAVRAGPARPAAVRQKRTGSETFAAGRSSSACGRAGPAAGCRRDRTPFRPRPERARKTAPPGPPGPNKLLQKLVAHGRIEGVGRLIHDEQRRLGQQHLKQGNLAFHAGGQARDRPGHVDFEGRGQTAQFRIVGPATQPIEKANQLPARHVLVQPQFARQIGDEPAGREPSCQQSCPPIDARPSVGCRKPSMSRRAVDFPEPFGPSRPKISPGPTSRSSRSRARQRAVVLRQLFGTQEHVACPSLSDTVSVCHFLCMPNGTRPHLESRRRPPAPFLEGKRLSEPEALARYSPSLTTAQARALPLRSGRRFKSNARRALANRLPKCHVFAWST